MKRGKQIDPWYPFYIYKWLFGSTRHELIINRDWAKTWPDLVPLVPAWMLEADFIDLRGIFTDIMTLAKTDDGFVRANETTPYPHAQLAGMWCVPLDHLNATISICLHKKVHKLEEPRPGIYYLPSQEVYGFSDRYKRKIQAGLPECSGKSEHRAGKTVPILKDSIGKNRTKDTVSPIITKWNEAGIRNLTDKQTAIREKTVSKIKTALKDYSPEVILKAIENYSFVLKNPDRFFFRYKWDLCDFIGRGLRKFTDEAEPFRNFATDKKERTPDRVGAHPSLTVKEWEVEKEITRRLDELVPKWRAEVQPELDKVLAKYKAEGPKGRKAFDEAQDRIDQELSRKIMELREKVKAEMEGQK